MIWKTTRMPPGSGADVTHLVLTRFNVRLPFSTGERHLDEEWLRNRLALLRRFCVPSMALQPDDVRWVLLVDADSPGWLRAELERESAVRVVEVVGEGTPENLTSALAGSGVVTTDYLITTRLDSDDALSADHCRRVRAVFDRQDWLFVEFPIGLQWFRGAGYRYLFRSNPFLSLIERVPAGQGPRTVLCMSHMKVLANEPTRTLWGRAAWLQVVHDGNVVNALHGGVVPVRQRQLTRFGRREAAEDGWWTRCRIAGSAATRRVRRRLRAMRGPSGTGGAPT